MTGSKPNLTPKQEKLIAALLRHHTVAAAAEAAGVSEATAFRWMRDSAEFDACYRAARRDAVQQAIAELQQASGMAVLVLRSVMVDTKVPASSRIAAASKIIEWAIKAVELEDIEQRLAQLEALMKEKRP